MSFQGTFFTFKHRISHLAFVTKTFYYFKLYAALCKSWKLTKGNNNNILNNVLTIAKIKTQWFS